MKSLSWSIFILSFLIRSSAWAVADTLPMTVWNNRKGVEELKKDNAALAQEKFLSALSHNPFEARLHVNLGLTFESLAQPEKARASYQTALELARDSETLFAANYNLGVMAQKE